MAKLASLWEGLRESHPSGTYIRPHGNGLPGYSYGRWSHGMLGHWRFEELGSGITVEACREALKRADLECERRTRELNKRRRRA